MWSCAFQSSSQLRTARSFPGFAGAAEQRTIKEVKKMMESLFTRTECKIPFNPEIEITILLFFDRKI